MANILQITPFMHVPDVAQAVHFFVEILGFEASFHQSHYAYVQREAAAVRILQASTAPGEVPGPGTRAFRYYIDVRDVQKIIDEVRPRLERAGLPGGHGPVDQPYGQREFMVLAPDGDLVVFGQDISGTSPA